MFFMGLNRIHPLKLHQSRNVNCRRITNQIEIVWLSLCAWLCRVKVNGEVFPTPIFLGWRKLQVGFLYFMYSIKLNKLYAVTTGIYWFVNVKQMLGKVERTRSQLVNIVFPFRKGKGEWNWIRRLRCNLFAPSPHFQIFPIKIVELLLCDWICSSYNEQYLDKLNNNVAIVK